MTESPAEIPNLKRATDIVPRPMNDGDVTTWSISDRGLNAIISELENSNYTGVLRASLGERSSRSSMLLFRGRCVGCIYSSKDLPQTPRTEQALHLMLHDLAFPETKLWSYRLSENIILPLSALFIGLPVERDDGRDNQTYLSYMSNLFYTKHQTACLAILSKPVSTYLMFVYKGEYQNTFHVESQTLSASLQPVHELLRLDPQATVDATVLPPETSPPSKQLGFSLSQTR